MRGRRGRKRRRGEEGGGEGGRGGRGGGGGEGGEEKREDIFKFATFQANHDSMSCAWIKLPDLQAPQIPRN